MKTEFFLGANSGGGFYSLYDEFCREKGGYLHFIKAGPGGGKSGFMKKIAQKAAEMGYDTELIRCSGDPGSLDGVYITQLNEGWIDATAPHICEPGIFGFNCDYVNLGQFCSPADDEKIELYTGKYKEMYRLAYSYLSAAESVKSAVLPDIFGDFELQKAKNRAKNTILREMGKSRKSGDSPKRRFIRCISCEGELVLSGAISELCKHIILIDDRFGLEQSFLREVLINAPGEELISCPSPLNPNRLDALLFPERGLAFVCASLMPESEAYRRVHLDALIPADNLKAHRREIRLQGQLYAELLSTAISYLKKAKEYHDALEAAYRPYIDFSALSAYTEQILQEL